MFYFSMSFQKMVSVTIFSLRSVILTVFIILLTSSTSNSADNRYEKCSTSMVSCGKFPNFGYPFWGLGRPQYCGHPDLQLLCFEIQGEVYPVLKIRDDESCYKVISTFPSSNEMTIQLQELPNTCPFHGFNTIFYDYFQVKTRVKNITLFYDCPEEHTPDVSQKSITCRDGQTTTYYLNRTLEAEAELRENCRAVEVPVPKNELDHRVDPLTPSDVLYQEFEVEYLNFSDCSRCQESGGICGSHDTEFTCYYPKKGQWKLIVVIAMPLGISTLIALNVGFWSCRKRKSCMNMLKASRLPSFPINSDLEVGSSLCCIQAEKKQYKNIDAFLKIYGSLAPKRYTYAMIRNMTNGFNERLGEGGYAIVYKGKLPNGRLVAVKLLKQSKGTGEDFINEVASICRTNHVNIVALLGFCFEGKRRALIYDFLSNGSLEKFVYHGAREQALPWETLFSIAVGIARGLDYLHRGCNARILHFDIKPHNILLDEDFCPKVSDFGLARLCPQQESTISMLDARGTIGYIAPEVFCRTIGGVSHKSDVYSYGMMILDIVCGRKNLISAETQHSSELYFPHWIYKRLQNGEEVAVHGIMNDVDKAIERKMILVSLWCIQTYPSNRPSMSRVIEMLQGGLESIQLPAEPNLSSPPRTDYSSIGTISLTQ